MNTDANVVAIAASLSLAMSQGGESEQSAPARRPSDPEVEKFIDEKILPIFKRSAQSQFIVSVRELVWSELSAQKVRAHAPAVHSRVEQVFAELENDGVDLKILVPSSGLQGANRGQGTLRSALIDQMTTDVNELLEERDLDGGPKMFDA